MSNSSPESLPHHNDAHAPGEHAEHGEEHGEEHGGGHAKHHGHADHGGGGHGGNWLMTYCDMITLLIAFFICILTFASAESGKHNHRKQRDSVLYGLPGTGIAGDLKAGDEDVVWRQVLISANPSNAGSTTPPLYSDPSMEITKKALAMLDEPGLNPLGDSYSMVFPLAMLFTNGDGETLSTSGKQVLDVIANNVKALPYDVLIQLDKPGQLKRGTAILQHFRTWDQITPSQLGVGIAADGTTPADSVRLLFVKQAKSSTR